MNRRTIIQAAWASALGLNWAALWAQGATPPTAVDAHPAPTLRIASNNTPLDQLALQLITAQALTRLGAGSLELVHLPSERALRAADAGELDGEGLRVAGLSAQYPHLIEVAEPYLRVQFVAFARNPALRLDGGWADLQAQRVTLITGWKLFEAQTRSVPTRTLVDTPEQMFQMLAAGRADVALYTLRDGVALARRMGLVNVHPVSPALQQADMHLYLHQRHAALAQRLSQTLRAMKADGTLARLLAQSEQ